MEETSGLPFNVSELDIITTGTTSTNRIATLESGKKIVIEQRKSQTDDIDRPNLISLKQEDALLTMLRERKVRVPQSYGIIETGTQGEVLVREFIDGETLSEMSKNRALLTMPDAKDAVISVLNTLNALTEEGFVHLDITDSNIVMKPVGGGHEAHLVDVKDIAPVTDDGTKRMLKAFAAGPLATIIRILDSHDQLPINNNDSILVKLLSKIHNEEIATVSNALEIINA